MRGYSRLFLDKMYNQVIETFNKEILYKGVDEFADMLAGYQFMLARLGESEYNIASTLFGKFSNLNFKLLVEASRYKNAGSAKEVSDIPRIPGETMIIFAERWNLDTQALSDLLGEKVLIMYAEENFVDNIKSILGCDFDTDSYPLDFTKENEETQEALAIFPKKKINATSFKLAQQIAGVPIIAEFIQPQRVTQSQRTSTLSNVSSRPQTTSRSNQTNTTSSSGRAQSNNAFDSDFKRIEDLLTGDEDQNNDLIGRELDKLRLRARNQRDATAMMKIADYYDKIYAYHRASLSREEAKTFSANYNNQANTIPNSGRTQSNNAFDSDFKRIDAMLANCASDVAIRDELVELKQRARNLRDAVAMRKIADYYDKACDSGTAYACREEAKTFER